MMKICKNCVYYHKGFCFLADFYVKKNFCCSDFEFDEDISPSQVKTKEEIKEGGK